MWRDRQTDRPTDRHNNANRRFSLFMRTRLKTKYSNIFQSCILHVTPNSHTVTNLQTRLRFFFLISASRKPTKALRQKNLVYCLSNCSPREIRDTSKSVRVCRRRPYLRHEVQTLIIFDNVFDISVYKLVSTLCWITKWLKSPTPLGIVYYDPTQYTHQARYTSSFILSPTCPAQLELSPGIQNTRENTYFVITRRALHMLRLILDENCILYTNIYIFCIDIRSLQFNQAHLQNDTPYRYVFCFYFVYNALYFVSLVMPPSEPKRFKGNI